MPLHPGPVVVVGASHAGVQTCASLRQLGVDEPIVLVGEEPCPPYHRPPLSKPGADDWWSAAPKPLRPGGWFEEHGITGVFGHRVIAVDSHARCVRLDDGSDVPFGNLVLATGAEPRRLGVPGADHPAVRVLRRADEASRLWSTLASRHGHLVVVGGGYLGLEAAATARALGCDVTVLEVGDRVLARVTGPRVSRYVEALHRRHGVSIRLGDQVVAFEAMSDEVVMVHTASGSVRADAVLVAVGVEPRTELLGAAGGRVENGMVVDVSGRTTLPDVFAAGDCTVKVADLESPERPVRIESVQHATDQGRAVAATIAGEPVASPTVPLFWSHQYDDRIQTLGLSRAGDEARLVEGGSATSFTVLYRRAHRVVAADSVNDPRGNLAARRLIEAP